MTMWSTDNCRPATADTYLVLYKPSGQECVLSGQGRWSGERWEAKGEVVAFEAESWVKRERPGAPWRHDFQGLCPDELQPDSRDAQCPACRHLMETEVGRPKVPTLRAQTCPDCGQPGEPMSLLEDGCRTCGLLWEGKP